MDTVKTMGWTRWALGVLAFVCACDEEAGECEARMGTYMLQYVETTGSCGPIPDQVITIDAQPMAVDPSCVGDVRTSEDNCDVTLVDVVCPEPGIGEGVTSTANGKAQWSRDGGTGDATVNLVVRDFDGVVLCQSSYEVAYDRI
jgi:hypothetical protein